MTGCAIARWPENHALDPTTSPPEHRPRPSGTGPPNGPASWEAELFRLLVENTRDYAVFAIDLEGRVLTWNAGAQHVLGYAAAEIVGQSSFVTFTPEDRA